MMGTYSNRFYMEMDAVSENEAFARVCIAAFCARLDPTLEEINDIKTAVSEAVTNAIIHGYKKQGGTIHMQADIDDNVLSICISDDGCGIEDVNKAMEPLYTTGALEERSGRVLLLWRYLWIIFRLSLNPAKELKLL